MAKKRKRTGRRISKAERLARRQEQVPTGGISVAEEAPSRSDLLSLIVAGRFDEAEGSSLRADKMSHSPSTAITFLDLLSRKLSCPMRKSDEKADDDVIRPRTLLHYARRIVSHHYGVDEKMLPGLQFAQRLCPQLLQDNHWESAAILAEAFGPEARARYPPLIIAIAALETSKAKSPNEDDDEQQQQQELSGGSKDEATAALCAVMPPEEVAVRRMLSRDATMHKHLRIELLRHVVASLKHHSLLYACLPAISLDPQAVPSSAALSRLGLEMTSSPTSNQTDNQQQQQQHMRPPPTKVSGTAEAVRAFVETVIRNNSMTTETNGVVSVRCFGSVVLESSEAAVRDVDLCLLLPNTGDNDVVADSLKVLKECTRALSKEAAKTLSLSHNEKQDGQQAGAGQHCLHVKDVREISKARVGVVKFRVMLPPSAEAVSQKRVTDECVSVDLVVNNRAALVNTELQRCALNGSKPLRALCHVVRVWASARRLRFLALGSKGSSSDLGLLSSYAWRLLCVAYCQREGLTPHWPHVHDLTHSPPLTTSITPAEDGDGGSETTMVCAGKLFYGFLKWLTTEIDYKHHAAITLHDPEVGHQLKPRGENAWPRLRLADPVEPLHDLGSHLTKRGFALLMRESARAILAMRDGAGLNHIVTPLAHSKSALTVGKKDKTVTSSSSVQACSAGTKSIDVTSSNLSGESKGRGSLPLSQQEVTDKSKKRRLEPHRPSSQTIPAKRPHLLSGNLVG
uniref:Poly(A) RNA polymerase mitochondrial-like central palm domain-containing protein n=1 Tax=Octactis speculum TaxID=3111310 RepID=A0A7S2H3P8_9STRA|mmetsp:Transcript_61092/g.83897  ORF Transcript_61092/g.83897 Transcript_61092/m.83897 type:complete len:741 (+) Transcript_61092:21-2243(+)